jgi:oxalate decarboxylase/phosphoglucose isomerase-like protein (cupin superfamily)
MPAKLITLNYVEEKQKRGFDIQGLQKSAVFKGRHIEDIGIHSINPGNERGGHYHKRKTEWLLPLNGKALFVWADAQNPKQGDLKQFIIQADYAKPCLIEIPPFVAHWVKNMGLEVFVMASFSTEDFNQENPDKYKVELPKK